jgi:curved DNA-binding protein CbpA
VADAKEPVFNPYDALNVSPAASVEEIEAAYRREASKAHPDREGGSHERMQDVNMAWKILSDPAMRAQFDRSGGVSSKVVLENKARTLLRGMAQVLIRELPPTEDMIARMRQAVNSQQEGCRQSRHKTRGELSLLRDRLKRLKGPPENFIESLIRSEIKAGEDHLPTYDADEEVFAKALEMLKDFRWDTSSYTQTANLILPGGSPFAGLYGVLGRPGG